MKAKEIKCAAPLSASGACEHDLREEGRMKMAAEIPAAFRGLLKGKAFAHLATLR
ncbi:MAG: hypothetical protein HY270_21675 [Deltaproteobacteria bacterium]|nr:hypothetical protein [Deltaproteobacteria bacterium]